ncbi:MAG: hypothetical protein EPGJADBJ_00605 [Saprospiraceae bacterium]|nr:hypothetical protein [Saprospiraceae bacterium]
MMPRLRFSVILVSIFIFSLNASLQGQPPATELRGTWIATVANIDWPSKPGLPVERQKAEFDSLLDVLKAMNMNAVFVQVRPSGDAFYNSTTVPWSKFLTGEQGLPPADSSYDPMHYMIKAAHDRRMEFHAWLNPYRATWDLDTASLSLIHPMRALPPNLRNQWFFRYGRRYYFNPANPFVRQHLVNVVRDIIVRYDVDGIHFDDYFYPYKEPGENLNDYNDFAANPRGFTNIEDWRRDNVNKLVQDVSQVIKKFKPYVRFGIGSFGVWRNSDRDPLNGSDTRSGITSYDDLYADILLWLKNGWIDYVAPQIYWSVGYPPSDYQKLLNWWSRHTYGKHLYIGQAAYKVGSSPNDANWNLPEEISKQVTLNRANANVQGSIFFSARSLMRNALGVQDTFINVLYPSPALVPAMAGLLKSPPATPQICRVGGTPSSVKLAWHVCDILTGDEAPHYFAIYRFDGEGVGNFKDPYNLLITTPFYSEEFIYEDQTAQEGLYYTYVVIAYNRANVESYSSEPIFVKKTKKGAKKKKKLFGYLF